MPFGTPSAMRIDHSHHVTNRLCITAPYTGGSIFQAWDEKIFELNQRKGNYTWSSTPNSSDYDGSADHRRVHDV